MEGRFRVLLGAISAILLLAIGFYVYFIHEINSVPADRADFVGNITSDGRSTVLYRESVIRYPAKGVVIPFEVDKNLKVGISVDKTQLDFGLIPKSLVVNKGLIFQNSNPIPAKVRVVAYGSIKPLLVMEESFVLPGWENKSLTLQMNASEVGEYSGEIDVIMRIPSHRALAYLI